METIADGKVIIEIDAESKGFERELDSVEKQAAKVFKLTAAAVTAVSSALAAGTAAAVAAGSAYEAAFAKTETIMDTNVMSAQAMSAAIIDLSNDTGEAATNLSEGVYNAISATGDTANAVALVADASKLATAGFTEQGDALGVLTTIMNSYSMGADQAQAISDSLIQTQNLGVTTVAELSANMGKAIATGSAYCVSLGNLESAYVSITKAGINTAEGTTYLSSMMNELGDTGSDIAKIIKKQTGKSFSDLMGEGKSLADVLGIVYEALGEDSTAMMNLWGSAEAGKAANAIINQGLETFNENLEAITDSAGATESAYETMTRTLSFQTDRLKTRIKNLGVTIYDYFSESLVDGVSSVSDAFEELGQRITTGDLADEMQDIGDAVSELITTGAELAADVLPNIIDGVSWIIDNGDTITGVLITCASAYAGYEIAAIGAKIATEGFTKAILGAEAAALPYAAAIGAAFAALAVVSGGLIVLGDALESTDGDAIAFRESFAEIEVQVNSVEEELRALIVAYTNARAEIAGTTKDNSELIGTLDRLTGSYDGSASALLDINNIIAQLNDAIPGLNLSFDEQAGILNKTSDELSALNEKYAAQQEYTAAQENLTAAQKAHTDAVVAADAAQAEYNAEIAKYNEWAEGHQSQIENLDQNYLDWQDQLDATKKKLDQANDLVAATEGEMGAAAGAVKYFGEQYDGASEKVDSFAGAIEDQADATKDATKQTARIALEAKDAIKSGENLADTYDNLSGELEALAGAGDPYIESLAEQALMELDAAAKAQELYAAYGEMSDSIGISTAEISGFLTSAGMSFEEFQTEAGNCTESVINSFQAADTSLDMSIQDMINNLADNIAATAAWNDNITELWNAAVASGQAGATEFVQQLYEMGPSAAAQVAQMVTDVDGTLAAFAPLFADAAQEGTEQAAIGVAMATGSLIAAGEEIAGELADSIAEADTSTSGQTAGENAATGLSDTAGSAEEAANTVAESAIDAFDSYANQFSDSGKNAATQIANAFTTGSAGFSDRARTRANDIKNAFTTANWNSLGFNIASGIAAGLSNGSYLITQAATSAAQAALNAAKSTLGVRSPSRVFRDEIGKMIPAGIALGIEAATPTAEKSVELSADQLLRATQIALRPSGMLPLDQSRVNSTAVRYTGNSVSNTPARRMPDQHIEFTVKGRTLAKAIAHDVGGYMEWEVLS